MKSINVLVIDDSEVVRKILSEELNKDPEINVVGTAIDPYMAREKIAQLKPDVLTLDIEMPRMNGVQFLRYLMPQHPMPVVVVSALTKKGAQATLDALEAGAIDFVTKPGFEQQTEGIENMLNELKIKIKIAMDVDVTHWKKKPRIKQPTQSQIAPIALQTNKILAFGASTGGVNAISSILTRLPSTIPGTVIVQHMPPGFTRSYAERLNSICSMEVMEASSGDAVQTGKVLIAPGNLHMTLVSTGGKVTVNCQEGEKVKGHCPSVEVLFNSVAESVGSKAIGIMLTGMGSDGADGMLAMREKGARTIAQDEKSSIVYGMPQEAYKNGGAERLVSLDEIPNAILELLKPTRSK